MNQDAIRTPAGLELIDHASGLGVEHHDRIAIQVRGVDQVTVGGKRDVADKILPLALRFRDDDQFAARGELAIGVSLPVAILSRLRHKRA